MPFQFRCVCGKMLSAPENAVGKRARCPTCHARIVIPQRETHGHIPEARRAIFDPTPGEENSHKRSRPLVLVADDNQDLCDSLRELLGLHGYDVITVTDGLQAVEMAHKSKPDLIILDVGMPKMTGFQVCERLRNPADPKNIDCMKIPILMLTIQRGGRNIRHAKSAGANDYLTKPFTTENLVQKIQALVPSTPPASA